MTEEKKSNVDLKIKQCLCVTIRYNFSNKCIIITQETNWYFQCNCEKNLSWLRQVNQVGFSETVVCLQARQVLKENCVASHSCTQKNVWYCVPLMQKTITPAYFVPLFSFIKRNTKTSEQQWDQSLFASSINHEEHDFSLTGLCKGNLIPFDDPFNPSTKAVCKQRRLCRQGCKQDRASVVWYSPPIT